jgi:hypothetical protein
MTIHYRGRQDRGHLDTLRRLAMRKMGGETSERLDEEWEKVWAEMDELAAEISKKWPKGVSAVDAVREQRRNLTPDEWVKPED